MAMHFLRTAEYRDICRADIAKLSDLGIIHALAEVRWDSVDMQRCPDPSCESFKSHYWRQHRNQWRCRDCGRDFSVTSGTPFAYHKKSLRDILNGMFSFCVTANGISTIELAADLGMTDKSAWYLMGKLREVLVRTRPVDITDGIVQADGGWFGGKRRDANKHGSGLHTEQRETAIREKIEGAPSGRQRRKKHMMPGGKENARRRKRRRCVEVVRELHREPGKGARRTIVSVALSEHEKYMISFIRKYVPDGALIMTDESGAFTPLSNWYEHKCVVHSREYVNDEGTNDNQAESYFSRLRRAEYGVHHQYTPLHLFEYAQETAWREDCRRQSLKTKLIGLLKSTLTLGKANVYRGYWQGNRLKDEVLNC
ncbi:MAG: IS1595 family transposase [Gammaproteobacteria bacterium]|nr:IS1595 family transposase [Gammaproteobacteria bacterium]